MSAGGDAGGRRASPLGLVWGLAWRVALRRRRLLALNVAIPLLLVAPVAAGGAPPAHASAVYAVLFVLFGTFGSAIPLIRDAERGLLSRVVGTGIPPGAILLERTGAGAALDLLQLAPSLACILVFEGGGLGGLVGGPGAVALTVGALAASLLFANLLGAWVAVLARSVAEGALFAAVAALLLLHGSGVFRTPAPGTPGARVEAWAPFRLLHESLLDAAGGSRIVESGGSALALLLALGALAGVTVFAAGRALRRLTGGSRR